MLLELYDFCLNSMFWLTWIFVLVVGLVFLRVVVF